MRLVKKVKGSALHFSLLIASIIALLLSSLVLFAHTRSLLKAQSKILIDVVEDSESGILKAINGNLQSFDTLTIKHRDSDVKISNMCWGSYVLSTSRSSQHNRKFFKACLAGFKQSKSRIALQLRDTRLPLYIVGNSSIVGDVYLGEKGLKAGIINSQIFRGNELIDGKVKVSSGILPPLDRNWLAGIQSKLELSPNVGDNLVSDNIDLKNSFENDTQFVYSTDKINITQDYVGNIIIRSEAEIIVESFSSISDAFLIAPKIIVKSGFAGNAHLLASEQIIIEEDVHLQYPSSIVLLKKEPIVDQQHKPSIQFGENSKFYGNVIYLTNFIQRNETEISISIAEDAWLEGTVYSEGNIELYGTVGGPVYAHRLVTNKFGSKYINYLYDGKLRGGEFPPEKEGAPLENRERIIAQWLY